MNKRISVFTENTALLRCPLCGAEMYAAETSLKCRNGHDFSLSRKGYCDLAPSTHDALYTRALFESRRRILGSRLYRRATAVLRELLDTYVSEGPVLDAGCGEGSFLLAVADTKRPYFGADLSREGIRLAASGGNGLGWAVADLTRLPYQDGSLGCILNILSPASYPEFKRALRPNGVLIKAVPGDHYLQEIRALVHKQPHSNEKVLSLFDAHFRRVETVEIEDTFPVSPEEAADLFTMTPLTEHSEAERGSLSTLDRVTVHLCFLVGEKISPLQN